VNATGRQPIPTTSDGVAVSPSTVAGADEILTEAALAFVAELQRRFGPERKAILDARRGRARRPLSLLARFGLHHRTGDEHQRGLDDGHDVLTTTERSS
jgi:hypothetical protein